MNKLFWFFALSIFLISCEQDDSLEHNVFIYDMDMTTELNTYFFGKVWDDNAYSSLITRASEPFYVGNKKVVEVTTSFTGELTLKSYYIMDGDEFIDESFETLEEIEFLPDEKLKEYRLKPDPFKKRIGDEWEEHSYKVISTSSENNRIKFKKEDYEVHKTWKKKLVEKEVSVETPFGTFNNCRVVEGKTSYRTNSEMKDADPISKLIVLILNWGRGIDNLKYNEAIKYFYDKKEGLVKATKSITTDFGFKVSYNLLISGKEKDQQDEYRIVSKFKGGKLNFRGTPTTKEDNIILEIEETDKVIALEKNAKGKWWKVTFNGEEGYVYSDFLLKFDEEKKEKKN